MTSPQTDFYITGGTLPTDASSYIVRQADRDLLESLRRGEFCYVLNTRQMGKSSLMVRTARSLRAEGARVVVLDLTAIGQNLTPMQWYSGLLASIGEQLDLEDELENYWQAHPQRGPMQRCLEAIRHVVLEATSSHSSISPLVVFVDEIDMVRSLPFSADEFFAGIRECYNRRTVDPTYKHLTFCLLGVATPADLISDTRMSPFNVGTRIELRDFTSEEARPLAVGLNTKEEGGRRKEEAMPAPLILHSSAFLLLNRVLYWTGGHPYLTQRLCRAVAEAIRSDPKSKIQNPKSLVDPLCQELFLTKRAREADPNLAFVRNRLLQSGADLAALLDLYQQIRSGRSIRDDETNPLCATLRLSGVVKERGGLLKVRCRIYDSVFDRGWTLTHLPGAEVRRQRRAYQLGQLRTAFVSSAIIIVMGILALAAVLNARRAGRNERLARAATTRANAETGRADAAADTAYRLLYDSNANLAQQYYAAGNIRGVQDVLQQMQPTPGHADLRGFEWYYLQQLCHQDLRTLRGHSASVQAVAFAPNGRILASCDGKSDVRLWDTGTWRLLKTLPIQGRRLAFAPNGRWLAVASGHDVVLLDIDSGLRDCAFQTTNNDIHAVAFSPDSRYLAVGGDDRMIRLWDVSAGRPIWQRRADRGRGVFCIAFSVNGRLLASGGDDRSVNLWDTQTGRLMQTRRDPTWYVYSIAFSPDGRLLATAGGDATIVLRNPQTGEPVRRLFGHQSYIYGVAFSRDGRLLASASWDDTIRLWDVTTGETKRILRGHTSYVMSLAFSPDSRLLATGSEDRTIKLWEPQQETEARSIRWSDPAPVSLYLAQQGRFLAVDRNGGVRYRPQDPPLVTLQHATGKIIMESCSRDLRRLATRRSDDMPSCVWDGVSGQLLLKFDRSVLHVGLSPNGRSVVTCTNRGKVCLWDVDTGRLTVLMNDQRAHDGLVAFSPDGRRIAAGLEDRTCYVWDARSGREIAHGLSPTVVSGGETTFSPDGRYFVIATYYTMEAHVFETETGRLHFSLVGHTDATTSAGFSPDGKRIVTGSYDDTVRLWDAATGRPILTLQADIDQVLTVRFSPDGQCVLAGGTTGKARIWTAATPEQTAAWSKTVAQ